MPDIFRKPLLSIIFLATIQSATFAQSSYYDGVNLSLTGISLKNELASHVVSTHNNFLSYGQMWDVLGQSDLDPTNSNNVLLVYGSDDSDGIFLTDRSRDKFQHGGSVGDWNREHIYPRSLGTPDLGTSGPGSDGHHLRPSDLQMNSTRGNHEFADGSGSATRTFPGWYPGDEWKGDCARIILYMYLRYGNQCLPSNVGLGSTNSIDANMIDLFLEWNVADPVSGTELTRNDVIDSFQGNRNPFIDNPVLATLIWGGPEAEDTWNLLGSEVTLNLKVLLEGAFNPATQLMTDLLRTSDLPITEPYSDIGFNVLSETADPFLLSVFGNNAIVDWILVEIRDGNDPTLILGSRVGLLQRDGDIIAADGSDFTMEYPSTSDAVYVAIRHRNHFGVRTNLSYSTESEITLNFSSLALEIYGSLPVNTIGDKAVLVSGDANLDGTVNVIDKNNFWRTQNGLVFDYSTSTADFNLDGVVNTVDKNILWRINNSRNQSLD